MTRIVSLWTLLWIPLLWAVVLGIMYFFIPVHPMWYVGIVSGAYMMIFSVWTASARYTPEFPPHLLGLENYYVYDSFQDGRVLILTEKERWKGSSQVRLKWIQQADYVVIADTNQVVKNRAGSTR